MSWQGYITNLEACEAKLKYAGIFGAKGGKWGETTNKEASFPCSDEEIMVAVRALVNCDSSIASTGIKVGGEKFAVVLNDGEVMVCQGKEEGKKEHSLVFVKTEQAVLVGFNPDGEIKTQMVRNSLEKMKDYLKNQGY